MELSGNTILVTGGTSGIGRAFAEQFHARGNQVIIAGRRRPLLDEIVSEHPGIAALELDIADAGSVNRFVNDVTTRFPALNVLVNNAGIAVDEVLTSTPVDFATSRAMVETNILGTLHVTAALLPLLREQTAATIVTTTSGLAFIPRYNLITYSATKAFLHSWTQSLRMQLAGTAIEVIELAPPYVATEFQPGQSDDPAAMPLAEFIAETMTILEAGGLTHGEILVERVKPMRWAERDGHYDKLYAAMNNSDAIG